MIPLTLDFQHGFGLLAYQKGFVLFCRSPNTVATTTIWLQKAAPSTSMAPLPVTSKRTTLMVDSILLIRTRISVLGNGKMSLVKICSCAIYAFYSGKYHFKKASILINIDPYSLFLLVLYKV